MTDLEYIKISVINKLYIYTKNIIRNNPIIFIGHEAKLISFSLKQTQLQTEREKLGSNKSHHITTRMKI